MKIPSTLKLAIGIAIFLALSVIELSTPYWESVELVIMAIGAVFFVKGSTELVKSQN